ncbi:sugar transferase [Tuanshanicoccus lijuaniae]|uniref:sugar transferase n=1 Tax=Aerococcaceae bacterium zg-1292 TaxID=2774330 RepID=UPI001936297E|nr:sugar transferase [Aerococcaceae bacterium zg-1292]
MILKKWNELPINMQNDSIKKYYIYLANRKLSLVVKRIFDITLSAILLILLLPFFFIISLLIKVESKGPVIYRQERVTQYGRVFKIHKFRTMVQDADKIGTQVTVSNDSRITSIGKILRKYRLDEIPQLIDILKGDMSFVGTRPEVKKYVDQYSEEMLATLLLPAGVTSEASINFKDEAEYLNDATNVDEVYLKEILPKKMKYNLDSILQFSFFSDIKTMINTVIEVMK